MSQEDEKKFLHDVANCLAVGYGNVRLIAVKLQKDPDALPMEKIIDRLVKAVGALEKVNSLLEQRRDTIK
jgi:hypothetical protein